MLLHLDIDDEEIDNFHKKIACNIKKSEKKKISLKQS